MSKTAEKPNYTAFVFREPFPVENPVSLVTRENHQCLWPVGDPKELKCCGADRIRASVYCQDHDDVAYVEPKNFVRK